MVNPLNGLLAAVQTAPGDYIHRCHPGDTSHPFYSMSYFTYTQLVRSKDATGAKRKRARCDDGDKEQRRRGRLSVEQYSFHGDYRPGAAQLLRATPALLNLMRKPPLEGANAEGFARLLLVLVKPFFIARDLLPVGSSSWHYLHKHMGEHDWDSRVKPVRANIANMQTAKRAANKLRGTSTSEEGGVHSFSAHQFFHTDSEDPGLSSNSDVDAEEEEKSMLLMHQTTLMRTLLRRSNSV